MTWGAGAKSNLKVPKSRVPVLLVPRDSRKLACLIRTPM